MSLRKTLPFRSGVVEGFFGLPWSWQARADYADFLSRHGFNTYLYAPKSDRLLRQDWQQAFPQDHFGALKNLALIYKNKNINFGMGLSPFELFRDFNTDNRSQLAQKIDLINEIDPDTLCVLFDDMEGGFQNLAEQQARITDFITARSSAAAFIFCPTYYSDDPRLITHFGEKPEHYLEDLGRLLDAGIDIFWTGPGVFSKTYPAPHLQSVADRLKRKPLIWDNYPVNDAARLTDFLHLSPFPDQRDIFLDYTVGHLANPMNQAYLSQIPLLTLSEDFRQQNPHGNLLEAACELLCPEPLGNKILQDVDLFQKRGLKALDEAEKNRLLARYREHADSPMAQEIMQWLAGRYAFDPNCLT